MKKIIEWLFIAVSWICIPFAILFGALVGWVQKKCGVRYSTYIRNFEGIGEMTSKGTSEKKCSYWHRIIDLGPWKNVDLFTVQKLVNNSNHLAVISNELREARQNISQVINAIRNNADYLSALHEGIDTLVPDSEVGAELSLGEPGNLDPYMAIFYNKDHYYVWFSIQNGKMTSFNLYDTREV